MLALSRINDHSTFTCSMILSGFPKHLLHRLCTMGDLHYNIFGVIVDKYQFVFVYIFTASSVNRWVTCILLGPRRPPNGQDTWTELWRRARGRPGKSCLLGARSGGTKYGCRSHSLRCSVLFKTRSVLAF